jgi:hypothetical protein
MSAPKSPIGLFAFWGYDQFPYVLGGPVEKVMDGGIIKSTNYGGSCFKPLIILPEEEGEMLLIQLEELRKEHREELKRVKAEFQIKLHELAEFIPIKL